MDELLSAECMSEKLREKDEDTSLSGEKESVPCEL
jgi:hypothetical protein